MRRICALAMFLTLCCLLQAQLQPSIQWRHSLSEALRDANGKRMILVFVGTTWEPWTATVKSRLDGDNSDQFTRAARKELLSSYIPVKLDAGSAEGKRLCEQYKIKSFPMFLFMSGRGKFIMKRAGYGGKF